MKGFLKFFDGPTRKDIAVPIGEVTDVRKARNATIVCLTNGRCWVAIRPDFETLQSDFETQKKDGDMNIVDTLRRAVEDYRKQHGYKPGRVLLKGEAAKAMADYISREEEKKRRLSGNLAIADFGHRTGDEVFLDGGVSYFKSIPMIAELSSELELTVE